MLYPYLTRKVLKITPNYSSDKFCKAGPSKSFFFLDTIAATYIHSIITIALLFSFL